MRTLMVLLAFSGGAVEAPVDSASFASLFHKKTLRIVYNHAGDQASETIEVVDHILEPHFPFVTRPLIDKTNRGLYQVRLYGSENHERTEVLYSRGFSSLFGEWRSTPAAKEQEREFQESIRIPFPRSCSWVTIWGRSEDNSFEEFFATEIDPAKIKPPRLDPVKHRVEIVEGGGAPETVLDLLFLGDGYVEAEAEEFFSDAHRLTAALFEQEPFSSHKNRFCVRALFVASRESGTDLPRSGVQKDTAFDVSFDALGVDRYIMTESTEKWRRVAASVPYDAMCILVNTRRYAGGGIFNLYCTVSAGDPAADYVLTHELGHSIAGLADEYVDTTSGFRAYYPLDREPWEPNVTVCGRRDLVKWRHLFEPDTPVPTPSKRRWEEKVGCFEGAGYRDRGLFRPQRRCLMAGPTASGFCAVCRESLAAAIRLESATPIVENGTGTK